MDINEIVPQEGTPLTQFTAAMLATKGIVNHINARKKGTWKQMDNSELNQSLSLHDDSYFENL
jgi:high-affinity Fe2+/Pb2+ permease